MLTRPPHGEQRQDQKVVSAPRLTGFPARQRLEPDRHLALPAVAQNGFDGRYERLQGGQGGKHQECFGSGAERVQDVEGVVSAGSAKVQHGARLQWKGACLPQPGKDTRLNLEESASVECISDTLSHRPGKNHGGEEWVEVSLVE